ncbi:hypothetical protein DLAC_07059 [Tieghemostelium lacteum]|uniref:Endo-beta-1,2-glucanase SGL domain-containing protein n=1 Tax=Tieghemostelium lacteum TaxID=361077 RepID=A0A151ZE29_TIELA|nr:hypothetical protein DLAC_07059 [Tieghemostelium lacteum]|eukprot:KYQ92213.1 hypothetical protein DLAC_07059 [Tieghemostelium lacteum]
MNNSILLIFLVSIVVIVNGQSQCRFAPTYKASDLYTNEYVAQAFVNDVLYWEGFFGGTNASGINIATGYTYDGHGIDYTTGQLANPLHDFSAPSKESIHLGVIARALDGYSPNGNFDILQFFHVNVSQTEEEKSYIRQTDDPRWDNMITILYRKIQTYENWNRTFPGYGGFMPWVNVNDSGIYPIAGYWSSNVPGLDNGEMIWGIYAVYNKLYELGFYDDLAERYENYFKYLISTAKLVFYQTPGYITSVTTIKDIFAQPSPGNYQNTGGYLDDPYEGELLTVFMDLFCEWNSTAERDQLWINKRAMLQNVQFETPLGNLTVQKGWWFSSHEQWKYFMLPYMDIPVNYKVFMNGEAARTWFSHIKEFPGLFASVTNVSEPNANPNYVSAAGIQEIAFELILTNDVITPYAAFPTMLANFSVGLQWYYNTLIGPAMQGPYGSTESVSIQGELISPVLTWDSKITGVLGILGGISDMNSRYLEKHDLYDRFYDVIDREWSLKFPDIIGENIPLMTPNVQVPLVLHDFTDCAYESLSSDQSNSSSN